MALKATTTPLPKLVPGFIDEMISVSQNRVDLTPRSRTALEELCRQNRIAFLLEGNKLAGWALIEPLVDGLSELGMAFIKPEYRGPSAFHQLCKLLSTQDERLLLATYDSAMIRYAIQVWGWSEISLRQVVWQSHGKFLTKRFDSKSRKSISNRLKTKKPRFVISGEQK